MTMILVHGGGFAASCWDRMMPYVDADTRAIDLPGRGAHPAPLANLTTIDFVDAVVDEIVSNDLTDVLLVGHSLAGITLPGVAARIPGRLRRLVFIACTVPAEGTSVFDSLPPDVQAAAEETSGPDEATLQAEMAEVVFCNDMDDELTAWTLSHMVPEAMQVAYEPVDLSGLRQPVPRTWVRLLRDVIVTPEKQDQMVRNMGGAEVVELDAAHMAMISYPKELAEILNNLA
ncbi:MAG TPA: alpha/beta fold hydrolase [Acidimicrobiia bacterium]